MFETLHGKSRAWQNEKMPGPFPANDFACEQSAKKHSSPPALEAMSLHGPSFLGFIHPVKRNGVSGEELERDPATARSPHREIITIMSEYVEKEGIIEEYRTHEKDTGSSEVQIALLTARISHLTEHLRTHRKDYHSRHGLIKMASKRRKLLDYLKRNNLEKYQEIVQKLKLRR